MLFDRVLLNFANLLKSSVNPRRRSSNLVCSCFNLSTYEVKDASPGRLGSTREVGGHLDWGCLKKAHHLDDRPGLWVTVSVQVSPPCPSMGALGGWYNTRTYCTCQTLKFYSIKIKKAKNTRKDGISAIYRKVFWTFSGNSYSTALSSSVPSEWIWCGRGTSPNFCKAYLGMGSDSDLRLGDGFWSHITKSHDTVIFPQ